MFVSFSSILMLDDNQLTDINAEVFRDMKDIISLSIQKNLLDNLWWDDFIGLETLSFLDLSDNL